MPTKKDDIVNAIICRIQNLLPEDCDICELRFRLELEEKPILQCASCGQSSHKQCIIDLVNDKQGMTYVDLTREDLMTIINPLGFPGVHYLCKTCEATAVSKNLNNQLCHQRTMEDHSTIPVEEVSEENADEIPQEAHQDEKNPHPPSQPESNEGLSKKKDKKQITCKFFAKGSCRHGLSGEGCNYDHPELCRKFTEHGTRQPRGCNKGKQCKHFHPQMCLNSLRTGKCLSQHCRYRHIKGTARHEKDGERNVNRTNHPPREHIPPTPDNDQPTAPPNTSDHFLEALRLLKAELLQEIAHIKTQVQEPLKYQQMMMNHQQQYLMPQGLQHISLPNQMSYQSPILQQTPAQTSSHQLQQNQFLSHPQLPILAINQTAPQLK